MELGKNILNLRKIKGFSQEKLGEEIDVTRQTISNWELGETSPNPEQLKKLAKVFDKTVDELIGNETKEELSRKISNTERLAGIIIKILKVLGIIFITYLVCVSIAIIALTIYAYI